MITEPLKVGDVFKHKQSLCWSKVVEIRQESNGKKYVIANDGSEFQTSMAEDFYLNKHCFVKMEESK